MKKINIKGVIISNDEQWIYDWFEIEATSPKKVEEELAEANGDDLEVIINSVGGDVFAGSEIYTTLRDYPANVIVKIVGFAGSAASVVAMAGKTKIMMSPTSQLMMHNASLIARGDYRDMEHAAGVLKNVNETVINAYRLKSGMDRETLLKMMDDETWLTPQQALEHKLIDEIMFDDQMKLVASAGASQMLPQEVINKMRNEFKNEMLKEFLAENQKGLSIKKEESNVNLTLEQIKNKHPELFKQIKDEGYQEGVKAERERIKNIDDLAIPGNDDILNKAKFETGISAEQVAVEIIKAEKQRGFNYLSEREKDAANLNDIEGSAAPVNDKDAVREATIKNMVKGANQMRGVNE